jgi:hypothetical protein
MKVCALAGGVGGAKLAAGLQEVLPSGDLTVLVNTADDFDSDSGSAGPRHGYVHASRDLQPPDGWGLALSP